MAEKRESCGPRSWVWVYFFLVGLRHSPGDSVPLRSNTPCRVTACVQEWDVWSRISWGSWLASSSRELSAECIKKSRPLSTEHYAFPGDPKDLSQARFTSRLLGAQSWGFGGRWTMTCNTPSNSTMHSSEKRNPSWALWAISLKVLKIQPQITLDVLFL